MAEEWSATCETLTAFRATAPSPQPAQGRTFEHPGAEEVFNSLRAARVPSMFEAKCDCGGQYFGSHSTWCSTQLK